ncbi:AsmA family protein [Shimia sp. SDUM112013]|uniref:AsmA family protein n=1 Tax=Shimia sp. SDUM112013 TaxID=3136160 RepID=UPI0032EC3AD4
MRLIRVLLMVVVALVIGLVVLVAVLPGEKIAKLAADQVKAQTGRELTFEGGVSISWFPVLGVSTGPVTLANADWSDRGPMFRADSVDIGVDLMALIGGELRIKRVQAVRPDVLLEVTEGGLANWALMPAGAAPSEGADAGETAQGATFFLEKLNITDSRLRYVEEGRVVFETAQADIRLDWPAPEAPAEVALVLRPAGQDLRVDAVLADLPGLLAGAVTPVTADLAAAGAKIAFDGRAALDPQAAGQIKATVPDPDALMAALGQAPTGQAGPLGLSGKMTLTSTGQFSLRDGQVSALGNAFKVQADVVQTGDRPKITAQIVAEQLDLSSFTQGDGDAAQHGGGATAGWSTAPIDASGLAAFDGTIAFAAQGIDLGNLTLGASRMTIAVDRSRAVFTLNEVNAYDGMITGEFVANNRNGLSVGGKMTAREVGMKGLLTDAMALSRFTGAANVSVSFLGVGQSVQAIMTSLKGDGAVEVGRGTISGIDLDRILRGGIAGGGTTVFDSLGGTFQIENGVLANDDLVLDLPSIEARGEGTVDLGQRRIDYLFTPQIKRADNQGLAVPVRIKGSWDDPKIRPQLDKALGVDVEAEKERLKDEAEARALQEVNDRLGVQPEEGQSAEDALKDKLEEKAKNELLRLLGGD